MKPDLQAQLDTQRRQAEERRCQLRIETFEEQLNSDVQPLNFSIQALNLKL